MPAVTPEHIVLGVEGRIVAFGRDDGSEQWETPIEGVPLGPVTSAPDNQVGILPIERPKHHEAVGELVGFELFTGEQRWTAPLRVSSRTAPPAVYDGQVFGVGYTEEDTPVIRAFHLTDGQIQWEQELDDPETPPVVTQSGVFVGDRGVLLQYTHSGDALNSIAGNSNNGAPIRAIAVGDETAFVLSEDGLFAITVSNSERQWHVDATPQADGICVGQDSIVAPVSSDEFDLDTAWPCIAAFSRSDGTVQWYHAMDDAFDPVISAPPVIADGAVFMMSNTSSGVTALGDLPPQEE